MLYTRNIAFTKLIRADGHFREFNFRRKQLSHETIYDIDVGDERGNRHYISLHKTEEGWTIREMSVPGWIREAARSFQEAIEEQENKL